MLPCRAEEAIMARTISGLTVRDIRTPTSRTLAGSDAVHTDPDYSATYVVLSTDAHDGIEGHGMTFTIGRGNEVVVAAHVREPAQMDRSRERRNPSGYRRNRKCGLGSLRQNRTEAGLETCRRHDARSVRLMHRLPLPDRRTDSRRGARNPARKIRDARRTRSTDAPGRLPGLHHLRRMDGLSRRQGSPLVPRGARRRWSRF